MTDPLAWWGAFGLDGTDAADETEELPERPDLDAVWQEPEAADDCDPLTGLPLVCCPVCGVPVYREGLTEQTCPVCGWIQDEDTADPWAESAENGMSLMQAQMDFRTFGRINRRFEGENEDAEF